MMDRSMVSRRRAVLILVVAASSVGAAFAGNEEPAARAEYSYAAGSKDGPENWGKLSPAYSACGGAGEVGKMQSPINIVTKAAKPRPDLDTLNRTYAAAQGTLVHDGKLIWLEFAGKVGSVGIKVPGADGKTVEKAFHLKNLHWHSPSEHTINGQSFPLELHMIHESDDGAAAVLAVLYKLGAPDSFYFQLKKGLAELAGDKCNFAAEDGRVAVGEVHTRSLQKRTGSYFRYHGSMTVPPCARKVIWNVLGKVRQISKEQLDLLTAPLTVKKNARPVQPLENRVVEFYNPPNSTISFDI